MPAASPDPLHPASPSPNQNVLNSRSDSSNPSDRRSKPKRYLAKLLLELGPGLITGASDDDPSGIATYSQAGAQFGYGMLWTMLFSYPLMAVIQEISARVGRVTGAGIASNIRRHYPRPVLYGLVSLLLIANMFNLGADIGAMGAAAKLLVPGPTWAYILAFGLVSLSLQIGLPYAKYVHYLKWLTIALFAYVATAIVVGEPKWQAIRMTFAPSLSWNGHYLTTLIAILGTTISPYLFFWQASQEAEEVALHKRQRPLRQSPAQAPAQFRRIRFDTYLGMALSNIVAFFIILTAAATLHKNAVLQIQTADQAARALEPLAGRFAFLLFALGIIGTGLLAVPVLAGSAAYGISEAFEWAASLEKKPNQATKFYAAIAAATLIGLFLSLIGLDPIKALFWAAVLNGIVAVPVMTLMMIFTSNPSVMGRFTLPLGLRVGGWIATAAMLFASLGMFATLGN
jgi:NRAMP (natural resistance-associated macrophage protein)-like metal ion transporter